MVDWVVHRRRWWIARAFGRNPLLRWTDRVEACVSLIAILLVLSLCPVCMNRGVDVYRSHAQLYAAQLQTRHLVTALVAATTSAPSSAHSATPAVLAVWSMSTDGARGGESQTTTAEWVRTDLSLTSGDHLDLWVDDADALVDPPTPVTQAGFDAISVGPGVWSAAIVGAMACLVALHALLDRARRAHLEHEINRFASGGSSHRLL